MATGSGRREVNTAEARRSGEVFPLLSSPLLFLEVADEGFTGDNIGAHFRVSALGFLDFWGKANMREFVF
uniref:Uncharacterized protein n=1 Tax=Oryza sativa subsp. japonica TaxID=39947 RepID=Q651J6_ORYSJ|nr:hypothetical protein [Oryza sativa Japonica Group]BAD46521.1 hypothetical protein [Oryza sativa Japonica Group]